MIRAAKEACTYDSEAEATKGVYGLPPSVLIPMTLFLEGVSATPVSENEAYPGIAHDFEAMRNVLLGTSNLLRRCLRHGLLRAEAETMRAIDFAWLVEMRSEGGDVPAGELLYLTRGGWTKNAFEAIWFCRKEDAEKFTWGNDRAVAREHSFERTSTDSEARKR